MSKRSLLAVLAHPDDETFGMGGTLAHYAQQSVDVTLACATRGEVGEMPAHLLEGFETAADRRVYELECAAQHLGLREVIFMDYRDSGMPGSPHNLHPQALTAQPLEVVAAHVARIIRQVRPQVVITFDPIGGYRHPDHIAIHQATVAGFSLAADPTFDPQGLPPFQANKLYFHVIPHTLLRVAVKLMPLFGRDPRRVGTNQDIDLDSIAKVEFPVHARINYRDVAKLRDEATACHASQGGGSLFSGPLASLRRVFPMTEIFMSAVPLPQPGAKVERDLFAGL